MLKIMTIFNVSFFEISAFFIPGIVIIMCFVIMYMSDSDQDAIMLFFTFRRDSVVDVKSVIKFLVFPFAPSICIYDI